MIILLPDVEVLQSIIHRASSGIYTRSSCSESSSLDDPALIRMIKVADQFQFMSCLDECFGEMELRMQPTTREALRSALALSVPSMIQRLTIWSRKQSATYPHWRSYGTTAPD